MENKNLQFIWFKINYVEQKHQSNFFSEKPYKVFTLLTYDILFEPLTFCIQKSFYNFHVKRKLFQSVEFYFSLYLLFRKWLKDFH